MSENEQSVKIDRIKELVERLNEASKAYYAEDREIMSNYEYDALYDELVALEEETGVVFANSPTVSVGYEVVEELPKEKHQSPMLSLDKTKSKEALRDWLQGHEAVLSWKLDGLTVVLTYNEGKLTKAVTRGNGEVGEIVTNNAKTFVNLPMSIPYQGELVLRGEAVISYSDFEKINAKIEDVDAKYKNPRNLCSGSVRQLDAKVSAERKVRFFAFSLEQVETPKAQQGALSQEVPGKDAQQGALSQEVPGKDAQQGALSQKMSSKEEVNRQPLEESVLGVRSSRMAQMDFLEAQGFQAVPHFLVSEDTILDRIEWFAKEIETYDIPSDGLVLGYDDIAYGQSLGRTAKFPRHSIAFKWADEKKETTLKEIEWSASRTGLINPVAIFEPVELEGTTVSRASVHNVSILRGLRLGIGDRITVYKANMIIPQIAENLTGSDSVEIPAHCPVCGGATQIKQLNDVQSLYCTNGECPAKKLKSFTLFVSRDAMNIEGLSEATLEKFIEMGFVREFADLFRLERYKYVITAMEGFGEKSYNNLIASVEQARTTTLPRVLHGLGIENIGIANAKMLCKHFGHDIEKLRGAKVEDLSAIEGVGEVIATTFVEYMQNEAKMEALEHLLHQLRVEVPTVEEGSQTLEGLVFVITGSLKHFANRNDLKDLIEEKGGKVTGSVTAKTTCLINNDVASSSSKNKKAKELGIPILSEEDFLAKYMN